MREKRGAFEFFKILIGFVLCSGRLSGSLPLLQIIHRLLRNELEIREHTRTTVEISPLNLATLLEST